uniref:SCP2 domain-containing protein n=1 Tax=Loa loa TaxID=7209 RepID=A0A1I7VFK0_LOALO
MPMMQSGLFRFVLIGPDNVVKKWIVDFKVTPPDIAETGEGNVDVEMTMKDSDFVKIVTGKLRPDQAFQALLSG